MKTVELEIIRSTVVDGKDFFAGTTVKTDTKTAKELVRLNKAHEIGEEDITIKTIEDMKKDELVEYAKSLGIDTSGKTKAEIITAINKADDIED
jgi:hypothetical protein